MSLFSHMDLNLINTHKKRSVQKAGFQSQPPQALKYDDFILPKNYSQNGKRIKLPQLLSYKLSPNLLNKFKMQQISLNDINIKISNKKLNSNSNSNSNLNSERSTANNTPLTSPDNISSTQLIDQNKNQIIKLIIKHANLMKKRSVESYQLKNYLLSILDFTQSYILFIIGMKLKEEISNSNKERNEFKILFKRSDDWLDIYNFGSKIINNFTGIIQNEYNITVKKYLSHILGLVYYMNAFIQIHRSNLIMETINFLKSNNDANDNNIDLISLIDNYEKIINDSQILLCKGETELGLFIIVREYPKLWSQSFTKLSNVIKNELIFPFNLIINKKSFNFDNKLNYCLPICSHIWDLNSMINFSGFFLKEWCLCQNLNHELIFDN
ncbi:hypothetical protein C6P40_003217 [Pichia californica]|uniref:Uncharacterized protein n=1 Tax=Pichia californica TaxID=460514 RepID=A0A9P6WGQ3_9ASCO|nr:hypothetical protein C6P40_003217 [[Candida] californica]